jgi:hypothetical protein
MSQYRNGQALEQAGQAVCGFAVFLIFYIKDAS